MMHKHAQMLYDIFKGYVEGTGAHEITLLGWDSTHKMGVDKDGNKVVQHPKTKFHVVFTLWRENAYDNTYASPTTLEFPELVSVKYLYRALHELTKTHNVANPIKEDEVYRSIGVMQSVTAWDVLVKDTDFEELEI